MGKHLINSYFIAKISLLTLTLAFTACGGGSGDGGKPPTMPTDPTEFIAEDSSFQNFTNWANTDYALGSANTLIGDAHQANNNDFARSVFENEKAENHTTGEYPIGSIVIKEVYSTVMGEKAHAQTGGVLAMVKRGSDFNPDNDGWEWFALTPDGKITARGADLMNGACNTCHAKATGNAGLDYTFNKPSSYVASDADFANYKDWTLIEEATGDSPANSGAHATNTMRRTYKKQGLVSPYFEKGQYPVGTVIVKELTSPSGALGNVYGMVKRGGDFSPGSNGWEWFLLDGNANINSRSGSGGLGFCTSCHAKAGDAALVQTDDSYRGKDLVFYKKDDPVPLPLEM